MLDSLEFDIMAMIQGKKLESTSNVCGIQRARVEKLKRDLYEALL